MTQFAMIDKSPWPQKLHIRWEMRTPHDETSDKPDERDEGFWPSKDVDAAGYVLPENYESEMQKAKDRMAAWENDEWRYVGVVAVAHVYIPAGGNSFRMMTLESAGLWGVESDSEDYLKEVFEEEKENLLAELKEMGEALTKEEHITI